MIRKSRRTKWGRVGVEASPCGKRSVARDTPALERHSAKAQAELVNPEKSARTQRGQT
jgi:hypothetical protein